MTYIVGRMKVLGRHEEAAREASVDRQGTSPAGGQGAQGLARWMKIREQDTRIEQGPENLIRQSEATVRSRTSPGTG